MKTSFLILLSTGKSQIGRNCIVYLCQIHFINTFLDFIKILKGNKNIKQQKAKVSENCFGFLCKNENRKVKENITM